MSLTALEFSPIQEIIAEIAVGRLVIVADDPSRENEADLVGAASLCTAHMGSVLGNAHFCVAYFPVMHKLSAWLDRYALNMPGLRIM
jgi:3,4-dihydroxy-2-butanone 4-phosphate synthase